MVIRIIKNRIYKFLSVFMLFISGTLAWAQQQGDVPFPPEPGVLPVELTVVRQSFVYGDENIKATVTADVSEPLDITVHYYDNEGSEVAVPKNAGTYKVTAEVNTTKYYGKAEGQLTITPRPLTVKAVSCRKLVGAADPELRYTTDNLVPGDQLTGKLERITGEEIGSYRILQGTLKANDNYVLSFIEGIFTIEDNDFPIEPGTLHVDISLNNLLQRYDGTSKRPGIISEPAFANEDFIVTYMRNGVETAPINVGTYQLKVSLLKMQNGQLYEGEVTGILEIEKRPLTLTPDNQTKIYGNRNPEFTYTLSEELISGNEITGSLTCVGIFCGEYVIEKGDVSAGDNYLLTVNEGNKLMITPRPITVTAESKSKIYGNSEPALSYIIEEGTLVYDDQIIGTLSREAGVDVGTYPIQQHTLDINGNYEITFIPGIFTISQRELGVFADDKKKSVGFVDPDLSYRIQGELVDGDKITGTLERERGETVGTYAIRQGTLTPGNNYQVLFTPGVFTIAETIIKVEAELKEKVYGEDDPELTYRVINPYPNVTINGSLTREAGEDVGEYTILQGSLIVDRVGFELEFVPSVLTIHPRKIRVVAEQLGKVYNESEPELTYRFDGMGLAYSDRAEGLLEREPGEEVGTYRITQGTLAFNSNYDLESFVESVFKISKAQATIEIADLEQDFDYTPKSVEVITYPDWLKYHVWYNERLILPTEVGEYTVKVVIDDKNYEGEETGVLRIREPEVNSVTYPEVITKNGSGEKSFVIGYDTFMSDAKLVFFNTRGKVIYEKNNYISGEFDMSDLGVGTYYFIYTYTNQRGIRCCKKGFVEIVD